MSKVIASFSSAVACACLYVTFAPSPAADTFSRPIAAPSAPLLRASGVSLGKPGDAPEANLADFQAPSAQEPSAATKSAVFRRKRAARARPPQPESRRAAIPLEMPVEPEQTVRAALRLAQPALELCYQSGLRSDGRIRGRIVVRLHLEAGGRVARAKIEESSVRDGGVLSCILRTLRGLRVAAVNEAVEIAVPLSLVPS